MIVFYTTEVNDAWASFQKEEATHIAKVLRKKEGAVIHFIDGVGGKYQGEIFSIDKKEVKVRIIEREFLPIITPKLHLAIAPTKNISRFEWFLEKATEIGVSEITPIITAHSERKHIRLDRLQKVLVAAVKQSLQASIPKLNPLVKLSTFLENQSILGTNQSKFIAYISPEVNEPLKNNYSQGKDVVMLIGPEGGFAPEEAEKANQFGFQSINLGPNRLRTETAGIVAVSTLRILNS